MEPKHRHCYFKRSASSCLVTPMHLHSSRISSSHSQSAGGIKPALASLDPPKTPNSIEKTKKSGGFLSFLFGKRDRRARNQSETNGNHISLEDHDVRKLIRLYCKHNSLYNRHNRYYGNKDIDDDCYNRMVRSFPGRSVSELRSCLEELRTLFEREYTIIERARRKCGEIMSPSIRYYNEFLFLVPHLNIHFDKDLPASGTSPLAAGKLLQNPIANPEMLCQKLTNFTDFPLAGFPGNLLTKRPKKDPQDRPNKKIKPIPDQENAKQENPIEQEIQEAEKVADHEVSVEEKISGLEDQEQKDALSPSEQKNIQNSKDKTSHHHSNCKMSSHEKDLVSTNLTCPCKPEVESSQSPVSCPWIAENSKCEPPCRETPPQSTRNSVSSPQNSDISESSKEPAHLMEKEPSGQESANTQQVQMLCDMIRTELTTAPDFIFFDAKWRIIEILREVHKRQLVHQKAIPLNNTRRPIPPQKRKPGEPNQMLKNPKCMSDRSAHEKGQPRMCEHHKGSHCTYCCRNNN